MRASNSQIYQYSLNFSHNLNESSILLYILIGYKPSARHRSFLANYISNITTTNRLPQFAHSADYSNSALNKLITKR